MAAPFLLGEHEVFVAIKNGMRAAHGYVCGIGEVASYLPAEGDHVKELSRSLQRFFSLAPGSAQRGMNSGAAAAGLAVSKPGSFHYRGRC